MRTTSAFFLKDIWTPQTRYAGRRMMAKSVRISKTPIAFQKGIFNEVSNLAEF
jgi:hypothetical protein